MIKKIITATILSFALSGICAATETWINDPSAVPLPEVKEETWRNNERYRILGDFNGDGIEDMALSDDISSFGNGGGEFAIYLKNKKGEYREYGKFMAHPYGDAIAIEKWGKEIRLWTYSHGGGGTGSIGYYEVNPNGLSPYHGLVIHPGDSGTEMGNAIYGAVFQFSDVKFKAQKSSTKDNKIEWK